MATPYVTLVQNVVASTQDLAVAESKNLDSAVLVIANEQTAGRGRTGNPWWQADRAVAASLAFTTDLVEVDETFPLAVGLELRAAIRTYVALDVGLKWPNDIMLDGVKVGGILVERKDDTVVVGCGLNLLWRNPPEGAGGLLNVEPDPDLGVQLSRTWADAVMDESFGWDRELYVPTCETLGESIEWEPDGRGRAVGIDADGGLIVATARGHTTLRSGEVRTVRSLSDDA